MPEAETVALMRFANHQRGRGAVSAAVTHTASGDLHLTGRLDWTRGVGYADLTAAIPPRHTLLWWDLEGVAALDGWTGGLPASSPDTGWSTHRIAPRTSPLDTALLLLLNLAATRPENPQLLRQSDARWLRRDNIDGVPVSVIAGPSTGNGQTPPPGSTHDSHLRYWIDPDGRLLRVTAQIAEATSVTADLPPGTAPPLPTPPAFRP